jgi:cytoskeletal protein CcmA (bactofilin family)
MPTSDGQQGVIELEELESGPEPEHRSARAILRPDTTVVEHAEAPAPYSPPAAASASSPSRDGAAVSRIGASIRVEGQLSGSEDMVVEGTVDGLVCLRENQLMVAAQGCVQAEIQARAVIVLGKVVGNISATELVQVMPSGCMDGDIRAGRVVLADGAKFRGNIQMGWEPEPEVEPGATRPAASP